MIYRFKASIPSIKPENSFRKLKKDQNWQNFRLEGLYSFVNMLFMSICGFYPLANLKSPQIKNKRARFWFTEKGYQTYKDKIIEMAKKTGMTLVVIKQKNPRKSQIVYQDDYQVAILPDKER